MSSSAVEQLIVNQRAVGSIPTSSSTVGLPEGLRCLPSWTEPDFDGLDSRLAATPNDIIEGKGS